MSNKFSIFTNPTVFISALMVAMVLPTYIARPLTAILLGLFLIIIYIFRKRIDRKFFLSKLFCILLLTPAFLLTSFNESQNLIRLVPISCLIILFPYERLKINVKFIHYTSALVLAYIIITQLLMSIGNSLALDLRNNLYYMDGSIQSIWDQGTVSRLSLLDNFRSFRSGGIFYNPNVLGSNIVLYFFAFSITSNNYRSVGKIKEINLYYLVCLLVIIGLLLTGSRTALGGFISFILFDLSSKPFPRLFQTGKINKKYAISFFIVLLFLPYAIIKTLQQFLEGFLDEDQGSLSLKMQILKNYILETFSQDPIKLLVGGEYSTFFDSDWGYLIGSFGFLGVLSILFYYCLVIRYNFNTFPVVVSCILTGFGNSLIFNLASSIQLLIIMIIYTNSKRAFEKLDSQ